MSPIARQPRRAVLTYRCDEVEEDWADARASNKYRSLIDLLKDREQGRPFVNVARRQIAQIEQGGGDQEDRVQIVNEALACAEQLYKDGQTVDAQKIWNSIVVLYRNNREMDPLVKRASARLAGRDADDTPGGIEDAPKTR